MTDRSPFIRFFTVTRHSATVGLAFLLILFHAYAGLLLYSYFFDTDNVLRSLGLPVAAICFGISALLTGLIALINWPRLGKTGRWLVLLVGAGPFCISFPLVILL